MFNPALVITILIGLAIVVLGVSVFVRNSQNLLNKLFFNFAIWVAIWLGVNYMSASPNLPKDVLLWANRVVLILGSITLVSLLAFMLQLTGWIRKSKAFYYLLGASALSWLFCVTPEVVRSVTVENGLVINEFGNATPVYFLPLFFAALYIGVVMVMAHRKLKGQLRSQVDSISKSVMIVIPVVIFGNAILPLQGNYQAVNYAPLSLTLVVLMMAYVIVRHKLFYIRPLIVRSLAYLISLGVVSLLYAVGVHFIETFVASIHNGFVTGVGNVLGVFIIIASYQPLKKLFDRLTNSLFYKDAYDPQDLYNELNRVHVTNFDLKTLSEQSMKIISKYMKTEYTALALLDGENNLRTFSAGVGAPSDEQLYQLYLKMKNSKNKIYVTDDLSEQTNKLSHLLQQANVAVFIRLRQGNSSAKEVGYLVVGPRNSGMAFGESDLRTLDTVVNELILAIQNALHFEEIQNFNVTLQQRVDDATRKFRTANEKLKKLDETKDEFISMASHQLRTPLTSVKGYLSMVLEGDAGKLNKQQEELLKQSFLSSERMVNLIADLLNLSRLNTGKFVIDAAPTDLRVVVDGEIAQLREAAKSKEIELTYNAPTDFPTVMLDSTKIHQVVMNFMDNALYYTPAGGKVEVVLNETQSSVEYLVKDNGIGVPRQLQRHLFSKFYRADNARRMRPDGTGLGLYMAQKVILAQGGSIIFESEEGKGSTFGFRFNKNVQPPSVSTLPAAR